MVLDNSGSLFAWGANNHGQCGMSPNTKIVPEPCKVRWDANCGTIVDISSGWTHCMLLTGMDAKSV